MFKKNLRKLILYMHKNKLIMKNFLYFTVIETQHMCASFNTVRLPDLI